MATQKTTLTLREARKLAGLGRLKCARLASIDAASLGRYETGKVQPGIKNATRIAEVLGVRVDEIVEFIPAVQEVQGAGFIPANTKSPVEKK